MHFDADHFIKYIIISETLYTLYLKNIDGIMAQQEALLPHRYRLVGF